MAPAPDAARPVRRVPPTAIAIAALLFVLVPFLTWEQTWFGRKLTDAQIESYLADTAHPRKIQHALSQISDRLVRGDAAARRWAPRIAELAAFPAVPIRSTAAWVMGQDNTSILFHHELLRLLRDPEPIVRRNAALSLVRFQDPSGRAELLGILQPYTVRATVSGRVSEGLRARQWLGTGAVVARISPSAGTPAEVRAPFAGEVVSVLAPDGAWVEPGQALVEVNSGSDQAWEALRGLYLVGEGQDVGVVQSYSKHAAEISDSLKQQAEVTARAIRMRSERSTNR